MSIQFRTCTAKEAKSIQALFVSVFTISEGEAEGKMLGTLVENLFTETTPDQVYCYVATDQDQAIGSLFLSRLTFATTERVYMLAPVAIATQYQGQGIGKALIRHAIQELRSMGVQSLVTYGDPAFYSKVGFLPLNTDVIRPPYPLSQPIGWLGQSFFHEHIEPIPGTAQCVPAFRNPDYW
jgi:predicted N-acetyltransferase YhbS